MSSITWYMNRLKMMSPKEVIYMKLWRFIRDNVLKSIPNAPSILSFRLIPFDEESRLFYIENIGKMKDDEVAGAEKILEDKIVLFGQECAPS